MSSEHIDEPDGPAFNEVDEPRSEQPTGPRGGTTTVTESGLVKKNFWVEADLAESMRELAFSKRISEAEIMRTALRQFLERVE